MTAFQQNCTVLWCAKTMKGAVVDPGHTPGQVVFHHAAIKYAIVGDVLFQASIGRTEFPRGDHAALIRSITTRLWPLGGDTAFVPGHGQTSNFAAERQINPFVSDAALEAAQS